MGKKKDPIIIVGVSNYVYPVAVEVEKLLIEINPKDNIKKYELQIFTDEKQEIELKYDYEIHTDTSINYFEAKMLEISPPIIFFCDPAEYLHELYHIKKIVEYINKSITFELKVYDIEDANQIIDNKKFFISDINNYEITSIVPKIDDLIHLEYNNDMYKLYLIITQQYQSKKITKITGDFKKQEFIKNNITYHFTFNLFNVKIQDKIYKHFEDFILHLEKEIAKNKFTDKKEVYLNFQKYNIDKNDLKTFFLMFKEIYLTLAKRNFKIYVIIDLYGELLKKYFKKIEICEFSANFKALDAEDNINLLQLNGVVTEKNLHRVQSKLEKEVLFLIKKSSVKPVIYIDITQLLLLDKTILVIIKNCILAYQSVHKLSVVPIKVVATQDIIDEVKKPFSVFKIDVLNKQQYEEMKAEIVLKRLRF